jgi:UDP-N-acetyl-D-glucosamine/UDP-N-acetyl-D-galactosamine dehydrogenase
MKYLANKKINISIIGLGYVGLPLAIEFAKKNNVCGFDINELRIKNLIQSNDVTLEVSAKSIKSSKIKFTSNSDNLKNTDIFILTIPTPVHINKIPDLSMLKNATKIVAKYLKNKSIVVFESTVYPGCTEEVCVPILEKYSNLKLNKNFSIGYSPERINPGDKSRSIRGISKVVSASNKDALKVLIKLYSQIIDKEVYAASSIKVAEASKIIENTQRDLNIGLMNELLTIFDKMNISNKEVLEAANTKWNFLNFSPGLVGGHCIGVDPYYLTYKSEKIGIKPNLISAARKINDNMHKFIGNKINRIRINLKLKKKILILGYGFKENCPDFRNTRVYHLIKYLKKMGYKINIHDPYIKLNTKEFPFTSSSIDFLKNKKKYDIVFLAVPHNFYLRRHKKIKKFLTTAGVIFDYKAKLAKSSKVIQF